MDEDRPLSEEETLALEFIRQNPGVTAEEVIEWFHPADDLAYRSTIANAVAFLWATRRVKRDPITNGLSV